jgi:hypothetical protein
MMSSGTCHVTRSTIKSARSDASLAPSILCCVSSPQVSFFDWICFLCFVNQCAFVWHHPLDRRQCRMNNGQRNETWPACNRLLRFGRWVGTTIQPQRKLFVDNDVITCGILPLQMMRARRTEPNRARRNRPATEAAWPSYSAIIECYPTIVGVIFSFSCTYYRMFYPTISRTLPIFGGAAGYFSSVVTSVTACHYLIHKGYTRFSLKWRAVSWPIPLTIYRYVHTTKWPSVPATSDS